MRNPYVKPITLEIHPTSKQRPYNKGMIKGTVHRIKINYRALYIHPETKMELNCRTSNRAMRQASTLAYKFFTSTRILRIYF